MGKFLVAGVVQRETIVKVDNIPIGYMGITERPNTIFTSTGGDAYNESLALKWLGNSVDLMSMVGEGESMDLVNPPGCEVELVTDYVLPRLADTPIAVLFYDENRKQQIFEDIKNLGDVPYDLALFRERAKRAEMLVVSDANFCRPLIGIGKELRKPIAVNIREYTEEQIKTMANEMKQVADKHIERESKWSGNIVVDNKDKRTGKLWNCDIQVTGKTSPHIILHEQIHAKSISYYDKETYCEYGKIEEAVVQYLTQEISKKEEITIINSMYDNDVKMLRKIREKLSFTSDYEFAKTLIDILVSERIQWIENKVYDKMLLSGTLEEYEEMAEIINKLGGNE